MQINNITRYYIVYTKGVYIRISYLQNVTQYENSKKKGKWNVMKKEKREKAQP